MKLSSIVTLIILQTYPIFSFATEHSYQEGVYLDTASSKKDLNNKKFINMCKNRVPISNRRYLVLDGPKLRSNQEITISLKNELSVASDDNLIAFEKQVDVTIITPQKSKQDYESALAELESSTILQNYRGEGKENLKISYELMQTSVADYLEKMTSSDLSQVPTCAYLDYMGTAGGNLGQKQFPLEDIKLYLQLAKESESVKESGGKITMAATFTTRTSEPPLTSKTLKHDRIQDLIHNQLVHIIDSQGFSVIEYDEVTYVKDENQTGPSQYMYTVFYALKLKEDSLLPLEAAQTLPYHISQRLFITNGQIKFTKWGFSPALNENLENLAIAAPSIAEPEILSYAQGLLKHQTQALKFETNECNKEEFHHEIAKFLWFEYLSNKKLRMPGKKPRSKMIGLSLKDVRNIEASMLGKTLPEFLRDYAKIHNVEACFSFESNKQFCGKKRKAA